MKHFPIFHCKTYETGKDELRDIMTCGFEHSYCPKETDIEYWFGVINEAVFDNDLPDFHKIDIIHLDKEWAWFDCTDGVDKCSLEMHHTYDSIQLFINVLGHEMVHYSQLINNQPLGHGKSFRRWERDFERNHLTLKRKW